MIKKQNAVNEKMFRSYAAF